MDKNESKLVRRLFDAADGDEEHGVLTRLLLRSGLMVECRACDCLTPADEPVCDVCGDEASTVVNPVRCKLCGEQVDGDTAHLHGEGYVGDECCWDERLRMTS